MEHIAALLLIIGCSDDLKQCTELPAPVPIYETMEECGASLQPSLAAFKGAHGKIVAQCVYVDPAMEEEDAELVWDIGSDGRLSAEIVSSNVQIASTQDRRNQPSQQ